MDLAKVLMMTNWQFILMLMLLLNCHGDQKSLGLLEI